MSSWVSSTTAFCCCVLHHWHPTHAHSRTHTHTLAGTKSGASERHSSRTTKLLFGNASGCWVVGQAWLKRYHSVHGLQLICNLCPTVLNQ